MHNASNARFKPLRHNELAALLEPLRHHRRLALAVSGGSDSMTLLHLAARWRKTLEHPPEITVFTVDHRLRPGSTAEAEWVGARTRDYGFPHHILTWSAPDKTRSQAGARTARYDLMSKAAHAARISAIVTAHTQDDQAETLAMRLARGSGLDGLAAMAVSTDWRGIAIIRPLLAIPRTRLRTILRAAGQSWLDDPSNEDNRFERVRVRRAMHGLARLGITRERLALSAHRLGRARAALDQATTAFLRRALELNPAGFGEMPLSRLRAAPEEIALRALARMITSFGGRGQPPRLIKLERLCAALRRPAPPPSATLGHCLIQAMKHDVRLCREPGRMDAAEQLLEPGSQALWDGRFALTLAADASTALNVRALALSTKRDLATAFTGADLTHLRGIPAAAIVTAPAFMLGDVILAAPSLGLYVQDPERVPLARACRAKFIGLPQPGTPAPFFSAAHCQ